MTKPLEARAYEIELPEVEYQFTCPKCGCDGWFFFGVIPVLDWKKEERVEVCDNGHEVLMV